MVNQEVMNGCVLAGRKSSRMGRDKALMRPGKKSFVQQAAEILSPFIREVTLLTPADQY